MSTVTEQPLRGEFLCVLCPNGCSIDVEFIKRPVPKLIFAEGSKCERGDAWILQEIEEPMRAIASNVLVEGGDFITASVRTSKPIPLEKISAVMDAIRPIVLEAPVKLGQVVLTKPAGTDTDIIATRNVARV